MAVFGAACGFECQDHCRYGSCPKASFGARFKIHIPRGKMASILVQNPKKSRRIRGKKRTPRPVTGAKSLPDADRKFLLGGQQKTVITFRQMIGGRIAKILDNAFDDFDLPLIAKRVRQPPTPSWIVLSLEPVIKASELDTYEAVLDVARNKSKKLQELKDLIDKCNSRLQMILARQRAVYRGMNLEEFEIMAKDGGIIGRHHRTMCSAKYDFVSFSISRDVAKFYAMLKGKRGMFIGVDISGMDVSEYEAIDYGVRNNIVVTRGGRSTYRPYEMFGGDQSCMLLYEFEVRLKTDSKPVIKEVVVMEDMPPPLRRRVEGAVTRLEQAQKSTITIKYM